MITEADTCRKYVLPKLYKSGWTDDQINEQKTFTDGRIIISGEKTYRRIPKRADYILRYNRDFMLAVVEAKPAYKKPADGLQQSKDYALILGVQFAYSTNGHIIIEHSFITGLDTEIENFPSPQELWQRVRINEGITEDNTAKTITSPYFFFQDKRPRYYQEISINRTVQAILQGKKKILLNLATGTGKTDIAFQICWKLWSSRWNKTGEYRRPKILYLSDRNILIDDPKDKIFSAFGDARFKIENGEISKSREIYFAIYQAIAKDERRPGLYREYSPDFFDLIVVDECHRGSARDESNWREILEYFEPSYQLGMTATPLREDNRDTYEYFGNPLYTYSLRQGIDDGFLAPYRVHRVISSVDASGWRPTKGELDRFGREIPDEEYSTKDFETIISLRKRTEAIAKHLADYMKKTDRFAKTIVFCVDQEHAEDMRIALNNLNADLVQKNSDYVCRVVSLEGDIGKVHLSKFQELETETPVILTTSKLLTTGVNVPTCKNIVIAKVINSMTDFKQTIGRGTRVRDDYGKYYFTILDYTGSATRLFADPEFDDDPAVITEENIDADGNVTSTTSKETEERNIDRDTVIDATTVQLDDDSEGERRKYYVDGVNVEIVSHLVYELDSEGNKLKVVKFTEYTAEKVRSMYSSASALRSKWSIAEEREAIISGLEEKGISFEELAEASGQQDADPFDLLCHISFNAPLRTRRERAEALKKDKKDFFDKYSQEVKQILDEILEKYAEHGVAQFKVPDILKIPPMSEHGNIIEISNLFGGTKKLQNAMSEMQRLLYLG
ncbi:MAG: DEAD/DEAH box helicase family protein [Bacteroidales bacterium]|nr:DEAD/DEAH box helicase family protein [Bacteroidales bacterium]